MKNKNLLQRTLTCVIGIPLLFVLIFLIPQHNFIGLSILLIVASFLGSYEMGKMLYGELTYMPFAATVLPIISYVKPEATELALVYIVILALVGEIKSGESDNFENAVTRISKRLFVSIYPSYFITFFIRLASLENTNGFVIAYYLLLVFSNDIFAYIFGTVFGAKNNAHLKASPKKSWAGFIGGAFWALCFSLVYTCIFKDKAACFNDIYLRTVCPILISIMADLGDLVESVIKRSAKVKDSSNIIPGHGGVLDRLDSIVVSIPLFYFILRYLV